MPSDHDQHSIPLKPAQSRYLSVTDTAKLIRQALAKNFPGIKFSVRSSSYSGGASIDINYSGGPKVNAVEAVAKAYQGAGFDGSIDLKYHRSAWLAPDGSVSLAHDQGTAGSMGYVPEEWGDPHARGCELVSFGADYVSVSRKVTEEEYWPAVQAFEQETGIAVRHRIYDGEVCHYWPIEAMVKEEWKPYQVLDRAQSLNERIHQYHDEPPAMADEERVARALYTQTGG